MQEVLLASDTLTLSCRDGEELADRIGQMLSQSVGADIKLKSMRFGMFGPDGDTYTINWKRSKK